MKHPRQSSYLNKVMLKKKGSTPDVVENSNESKTSDKESETPSSKFIEKIKNL